MTAGLSRTSALASRHTALAAGTTLRVSGNDVATDATVVSSPIYDPGKTRTHE
ncbi:hypothetical protein ABLN87_09580 [Ruegeria sp. SCPT10]|uniref:hypothetical protein n=1 Tax=Ruegeria sp. SCP10 TaxID=3141377 RepID=UPI00333D74C2